MVTLPNASIDEFSVSCPGATPVPERGKLTEGLDALLATVAVPLKAPAEFGENITLIEALCPDAIVTGRLGEVSVKYLLDIATLETVRDVEPEFVAKTVRVLPVPAFTLPKSSEAAPKERVPWPEELPPALTPWQPVIKARNAAINSAPTMLARFFQEWFSGRDLSMVT